jgi:peroxiredoxin
VGDRTKSELLELRFLAIGVTAPDIEGEDQDGRKFKLSDNSGKVVLLEFWSQY